MKMMILFDEADTHEEEEALSGAFECAAARQSAG